MTPQELLKLVEAEEYRRRLSTELYRFVQEAWPVVEPGVPFSHGWHLEVICEHLEAITEGDIRRLLINVPPRHSKSTIVAVMWPVWEWITRPEEKYLCASYSGTLSTRDALKARRLIQSPWFQSLWGTHFKLTGDQNAKQRYENDHTGYRIASSVGGTATGEGGSRLLLDDPHGAQDAQSDALRENALEWFDMVWATRLNNPRTDAMVTIMQRLHDNDVSGHILRDLSGWEHLCLPAEWDGVPRKTFLGSYDPRTEKGQLLWPDRFTPEILKSLKEQLGEYGTAGQLQQDPMPATGGILNTSKFNLWPSKKPLPAFEYVVQSYDCAFTEKTTGDPTACSVWGLFRWKDRIHGLLLDAWDDHLSYPNLRKKVIDDWGAVYGKDEHGQKKTRKPDQIIVEEKASGQSLIQDLHLARVPVIGYNPGNADKISRAHQAAPVLETGVLWVMESNLTPGAPVSWASTFMKQLSRFPVAPHDDYVDTFTQTIIYLKNNGWFDLQQADPDEPENEIDYYEKKKTYLSNPYAV